jgi:hypothetical protein
MVEEAGIGQAAAKQHERTTDLPVIADLTTVRLWPYNGQSRTYRVLFAVRCCIAKERSTTHIEPP